MQKETEIMLDKVKAAQSEMDKKCHDLFLNKEILAPVLKETVEEYEGLTVEDIIGLIDEASISKIEAVSDFPQSITIEQIDTDLKSVTDKLVLFDIHFKAALPKDRQTKMNFQLFIDFEAQGTYYPGYPLTKRAMYYVARSLSRQLGELTEETDYGKLQKAYSIWVYYDPQIPQKFKNTVSRYKMTKEDFYGEVIEKVADYDLMEVVMVRLDTLTESTIDLFDYLKGIFTNNKEKITRHIGNLSDDIMKEVDIMGGVGAFIFEQARTEGLAVGLEQGRELGLEQGRELGLEQGRELGLEQGREQGLQQERRNQIEKLLKKGKTPEDIANYNDYPIELVKSIQKSLLVTK